MRILVHCNAPYCGTGYGQEGNRIGRMLRDLGHTVAFSAFWGLSGNVIEWEGFTVYPDGYTPYGHDIVDTHARHFEADFFLTLQDVWPLPADLGNRGIPWAAIVPVDSAPVAEMVKVPLVSCFQPIAMSKWGQEEFAKAGIRAAYLPHTVDTRLHYREATPQAELKTRLGFPPDSFLVGMVSANKGYPSRKGFEEAFAAFAQFATQVPEARLYVHAHAGSQMGGPDLQMLAGAYGISDRLRFLSPYYLKVAAGDDEMRQTYNAFDVLLAPSLGEGFGIPVLEAQANGCPVIVNDYSAQTELCGAGWAVKPARLMWTPLGNFFAQPSIPGLVEALHQAHRSAHTLRDQAVRFAARYATDRIRDLYLKPIVDDLERRICGPMAGSLRLARGEAPPRTIGAVEYVPSVDEPAPGEPEPIGATDGL